VSDDVRILIVDVNAERAAIIGDGLREAGHHDVVVLAQFENLLRRIADIDPDVIFIDLEDPHRDVLEAMFQVSRVVHRPIAMFVDNSETGMIEKAIEAGVATYVVNGLKKERVKSVLDTAVGRFRMYRGLREQLDHARQALEERKLIDRAKGILMNSHHLTEAQAYEWLRKSAMEGNLRMVQLAKRIVTAHKASK